MRAFVWYAEDSFLHRLNPLTKLAACLLAAIVVSTAGEPVTPAIVILLALASTRGLGKVPVSMLCRTLAFGLLASLGVFWTYTVFYGGSGEPWLYGATMAARLLAILSSSAMFVLTTDPSQFVRSLIHQARVSPRIAYSLFAAYRFVPLLQVEFETIRAAHQMRGGVGGGGPFGQIREIVGYAIPLLASAVRKGERVALAMESRGFGALSAQQRTYFRVTTINQADLWFGVGCLLAAATLIALRRIQ
ncbi:MAG TPA: energy-coupling factor transporter transmembrane component T [Chloroflexota bacterium]|nr:energy-coupling factor transporter transmembrane component T [Chloroflexota bacterium]